MLNFEINNDSKLSYLREEGCFYRVHSASNVYKFRSDLMEIYVRYLIELARLSEGKYRMEI